MITTAIETTYCRHERRIITIDVLSPQERAEKIQRYVERVNQFYQNVYDWLQEYPNVAITKTDIEMNEEGLDSYHIDKLSIAIHNGKEEEVVDIRPGGATVIMCEGTLEIEGWLRDFVAYMWKGGPIGVESKTGRPIPAFQGINEDGWYWIDRHNVDYAKRVNKPLLLKLFSWVSSYDFQK
jgi:hypothetical protein